MRLFYSTISFVVFCSILLQNGAANHGDDITENNVNQVLDHNNNIDYNDAPPEDDVQLSDVVRTKSEDSAENLIESSSNQEFEFIGNEEKTDDGGGDGSGADELVERRRSMPVTQGEDKIEKELIGKGGEESFLQGVVDYMDRLRELLMIM